MPKYPNVTVEMIGQDGNSFSIIGRVTKQLRRGGVSKTERDRFTKEATSGDYSHLIGTVFDWVSVEEFDEEEEAQSYFEDNE
jgi:hypothetical protein